MISHRRESISITGPRAATRAVIALFLAFSAPATAASEDLTQGYVAANAEAVVSSVVYVGNGRTRPAAMKELVGIAPGQRVGDIDLDATTQRLLKSGLFSAVGLSCSQEGDGLTVTVTVAEKWTFIPIPFASIGTGSWSAGAAILDFNAFGMRKTMLLGALATNIGIEGAFAYVDPRFAGSDISASAFGAYGTNSAELETMDGAQYAAYLENTWRAGLRLEYPGEGALKAKLEATLRHSGVSNTEAAAYGLDASLLSLIPGIGITWDGQRNEGYFSVGPHGKALYKHGFGLEGRGIFDSIEASGGWSAKVLGTCYLEVGASAAYGTTAFQLQSALSGKGFRTLPASTSYSSKDIGAYACLEIPALTPSWCVVTIGPFYEAGAYETGLDASVTTRVFHGPGLGCHLYLSKVAFPALGLDFAYNILTATPVFSAYVGLSFY